MKQALFILLLLILFTGCSHAADDVSPLQRQKKPYPASEDSTWLTDRARLDKLLSENITDEEDCRIRWNILWPWAKKGNLEARAILSMLTFTAWPLTPQIFLPGRSGDQLSSMRDAAILSIHSIGVRFDDNNQQARYDSQSKTIYNEFLPNVAFGSIFQACLKEKPGEYCTRLASSYAGDPIRWKLIPTFKDYAAEIDALLAQGMKPHCLYLHDRHAWGRGRKQRFIHD